jgi:hypothetical protein
MADMGSCWSRWSHLFHAGRSRRTLLAHLGEMVMADLTDADLDAIEARLDAATPGPWHVEDDHATENQIWTERRWEAGGGASVVDAGGMGPADADLIAHAPNDLRALLAEVRRGRRIEAAAWELTHCVDGPAFDKLQAALAEEPDHG